MDGYAATNVLCFPRLRPSSTDGSESVRCLSDTLDNFDDILRTTSAFMLLVRFACNAHFAHALSMPLVFGAGASVLLPPGPLDCRQLPHVPGRDRAHAKARGFLRDARHE